MHIEINLTDQVDFRTERCTSCQEICTPHTESVINLFMACRLSMHSPRVVPTKQLHSMHVLRQLHLPLQALELYFRMPIFLNFVHTARDSGLHKYACSCRLSKRMHACMHFTILHNSCSYKRNNVHINKLAIPYNYT